MCNRGLYAALRNSENTTIKDIASLGTNTSRTAIIATEASKRDLRYCISAAAVIASRRANIFLSGVWVSIPPEAHHIFTVLYIVSLKITMETVISRKLLPIWSIKLIGHLTEDSIHHIEGLWMSVQCQIYRSTFRPGRAIDHNLPPSKYIKRPTTGKQRPF